ncbi:MAG: CRTAC1 family protein, partial [Planctomycetota bacterium]
MNRKTIAGAMAATASLAFSTQAQVTFSDQTTVAGLVATHEVAESSCPGPQERMIAALAIGDFNRDGWPDVYFSGGGLAPDRLFMNNRDGTFTDQAVAWGITELHTGSAAAVGDYDGDGWQDIYVSSFGSPQPGGAHGSHKLFRNNGDGTFTNVAAAAGVDFTTVDPDPTAASGVAWGDYDLDGSLDLMVAGWTAGTDGNRLFHNNGDGTFDDVTETVLGDSIIGVRGLQPAFADMDGDLFPELLMANDYSTSRYYVNNGDGTFTDYTVPSGTGLDLAGMGQAIADLDNDGLFDWYVTSIYESDPPIGNMLYMHQGAHLFTEISQAAGVDDGQWGWATLAVDLDHDGFEELVEVNGWTGPEWENEPPKLFYNNGDETFTEIAAAAGLTDPGQARGLVYMDAEQDGDLDLIISNNQEPPICYRNDTKGLGHWLQVQLDTSTNALLAPDGFGARVETTAGGITRMRIMNGAPSYLTTSELMVHFGLGDATAVDELRVH